MHQVSMSSVLSPMNAVQPADAAWDVADVRPVERIVLRYAVVAQRDRVDVVHMFVDQFDLDAAAREAYAIVGARPHDCLDVLFHKEMPDHADGRHVQLRRKGAGMDAGCRIVLRPRKPGRSSVWTVTHAATRRDVQGGKFITLRGHLDGEATTARIALDHTGNTFSLQAKDRKAFRVDCYDGPIVEMGRWPDHDAVVRDCVARIDRALGKASAEGIRYTYEAHLNDFARYGAMIRDLDFEPINAADDRTMLLDRRKAMSHCLWMCEDMGAAGTNVPVDKMARWLAFVQTLLAIHDVTDVRTERDATRPEFSLSNLSVDMLCAA
jgi:hypothetical protein